MNLGTLVGTLQLQIDTLSQAPRRVEAPRRDTPTQADRILAAVGAAETPPCAIDIARAADLKPGNVQALVSLLHRAGKLERVKTPDSPRVRWRIPT